jgi:hypothetical protein
MKKDEVKEEVKKTCVKKYGNAMPINLRSSTIGLLMVVLVCIVVTKL